MAILGFCVSAHLITGTIDRKGNLLDYSKVKVVLNDGEYNALVDQAGHFKIAVPNFAATYKLEVQNINFYFEPVVVDVLDEEFAPGKFIKAYLFDLRNGKDFRLMYPLQLDPSSRLSYFEDRVPFDPTAYLKNPFVWMIGLSLLMSTMMKNMDKEELKEAQKSQQQLMGDMPQSCQQQ